MPCRTDPLARCAAEIRANVSPAPYPKQYSGPLELPGDRPMIRQDLPVVMSWGMGADSTGLLLRWLHEPQTRPCSLDDLLVVTAMTGDEWPVTGILAEQHILPRMRAFGVRWVQVARAGASQSDGISVLDDSRRPARVHLAGDWKLSDELRAAGTVPQVAGSRRCSLRAKGWVLDEFLGAEMGERPYLHAMGYEVTEWRRARRDAGYDTGTRTGIYPLLEWKWDRRSCEDYIRAATGVNWPKSACTYCPFALASRSGRARVLPMYQADPDAAVQALSLEYLSVALNPRQGLAGGKRLAGILAATGEHEHVLAAFTAHLNEVPWQVYEVRRAARPRQHSGSGPPQQARSLHGLGTGTRSQTRSAVLRLAQARHAELEDDDGIIRAWIRRRSSSTGTTAEHFITCAPAGALDKEGRGFEAAWAAAR
jgi:hypothetical protein